MRVIKIFKSKGELTIYQAEFKTLLILFAANFYDYVRINQT